MVVKLVQTEPRVTDQNLVVDGSAETIAEAYLSKGWKILAIFPTGQNVTFILQQA